MYMYTVYIYIYTYLQTHIVIQILWQMALREHIDCVQLGGRATSAGSHSDAELPKEWAHYRSKRNLGGLSTFKSHVDRIVPFLVEQVGEELSGQQGPYIIHSLIHPSSHMIGLYSGLYGYCKIYPSSIIHHPIG